MSRSLTTSFIAHITVGGAVCLYLKVSVVYYVCPHTSWSNFWQYDQNLENIFYLTILVDNTKFQKVNYGEFYILSKKLFSF